MRGEIVNKDCGSARITPDSPVTAATVGSWDVVYTVGARGLEVGAVVRFEIPYGFSAPQVLWDDAAGHVQAAASRPGAAIDAALEDPAPRSDRSGYVTRYGRHVFCRLSGEPLVAGDTVTLHYGKMTAPFNIFDVYVQSGARAQHFAKTVEFTVAVDPDGTHEAPFGGFWLVESQAALKVIGGQARQLSVITSSNYPDKENISLAAIAKDRFGNVSPGFRGKFDVFCEGGTLDPGAVLWTREHPGIHVATFSLRSQPQHVMRFQVRDVRGGTLAGISNPIMVRPAQERYHIYWGDLHGHSVLSDGLGPIDDYFRFGREVGQLDFCAAADHAQYMSDEDWGLTADAVERFNAPGRFVTVLGYEYSHNAPGGFGDKCIYYPGQGPLLRERDIDRGPYSDLARIGERLKEHGAMMVAHMHAGGGMRYLDPDVVRLCEIYSVWGAGEYRGNPKSIPALRRDEYVQDVLASGARVGILAASDCHAGHPGDTDWLRRRKQYHGGLAAVLAEELTRQDVFQALWHRRCYGTTGARIVLEFALDDQPMGSEVKLSPGRKPEFAVRVSGTADLAEIVLVRDNRPLYTHACRGMDESFTYRDDECVASACYYVRVQQVDDEFAWSSPIWVDRTQSAE